MCDRLNNTMTPTSLWSEAVYRGMKPFGAPGGWACAGSGSLADQDIAYLQGQVTGGAYMPRFWPLRGSSPLTTMMAASSGTYKSNMLPAAYFPWDHQKETHSNTMLWNKSLDPTHLIDTVMPGHDEYTVLPGPGFNLGYGYDANAPRMSKHQDACKCIY